MFTLDPRLQRDTFPVCDLSLCKVLLMNNAHFPWLILVPQHESIREIIELAASQRHQLMDEISMASEVLQQCCMPDKLNIAALGNQVEQLHVHVIARFKRDVAWPKPVWGGECEPYANAAPLLSRLKTSTWVV